jgi:hypothetical protein
MARLLYFLLCLPFLFAASPAGAVPVLDNYVGAAPTHPAYAGLDVIGAIDEFDIEKVDVTLTADTLSLSIFSSYFDNVGALMTELGDVFLSPNQWNPFGPAPYVNDSASNGESWEYALVLDDHGEAFSSDSAGYDMTGQSGDVSLFSVADSAGIVLSDHVSGPGYIYRGDQEVQLDTTGATALANGTWSIIDKPGIYDELNLMISLIGTPLANLDSLGFHWGFTCANDVVEGSANSTPVPEPATLLFLASALLGGAAVRKKA